MGRVIKGRWPHIEARKAARDAGLQRFEHACRQAAIANAVFAGSMLLAVGIGAAMLSALGLIGGWWIA